MKTDETAQTYFSTSQAAKILGLSVGTIQRMVKNGVFKAYVTQGGHRRILSSSLNKFCAEQGFSAPQAQQHKSLICILHDSAHVDESLVQMNQWPGVKIITHPLDLMRVNDTIGNLFIDARISWLHASPLQLNGNLAKNAKIVIYNSTQLPKDSALKQTPGISLFEGDLSADLIRGYQLGSAAPRPKGESNA
jgi:excisionase family DNA binding protein